MHNGLSRKLALFSILACMSGVAGLQAQQPTESLTVGSLGQLSNVLDRFSYFPLEVGNEWVYTDGQTTYKVQVLRELQQTYGQRYFEVSGYFQFDTVSTRMIRRDLLGQILESNPKGEDFLWYRFLGRSAWRFESGVEVNCITGSQVKNADASETIRVPAGTFTRVARLDFVSPCADGGLSSEYFAPGVGLVRRVLNTIAGPRNIDLVSAKIGSQRYPALGYGVEVAIDRPVYFYNLMPPVVNPTATLKAQLTVRNETATPVEFLFASSQRFEFVLRDAFGKEVLRWSDGRNFLTVLGHETLTNGRLSYSADLALKARDGKLLPAGFYTLTGYLTTIGSQAGLLPTTGSVSFELKVVH